MILRGRRPALALLPLALLFAASTPPATADGGGVMPIPTAAPAAPSPAPTETAVGPQLYANDPCTTINAITTRPTVTTAACTVRPGHVLLETGYQSQTNVGSGQTVLYPQADIRIGLTAPRFELGFTPPEDERQTSAGATQRGVTDASVALKYLIGGSPAAAYSTFVQAGIPTGDAAFTAGGSNLEAGVNGTAMLSPALGLNATLAGIAAVNGSARYGQFVPSVYASLSLPTSFPLAVLAEGAAFTNATGASSATRYQYITGLTAAASAHVQFDLEYGFSPTAATGKYRYVGFGASFSK